MPLIVENFISKLVTGYISLLTLFRMGGTPTSFSPVTSTNVEISHQNVLTLSFNPPAALV